MAREGIELSESADAKCRTAAARLAIRLGENEAHVVDQIYRTLAAVGPTITREVLRKADERQESNNPVMVRDGSRPRSLGGAFFYLAYPYIPEGYRMWVRFGQKSKAEIQHSKRKYKDEEE